MMRHEVIKNKLLINFQSNASVFFFQSTFPDDYIFVFHQNLRTQRWRQDVVEHRFHSRELLGGGKICHQSSFSFFSNFYIVTAEHNIQYVSVSLIYSTQHKLSLWDRTSWLRYVMFQTAIWCKLESLLIKKKKKRFLSFDILLFSSDRSQLLKKTPRELRFFFFFFATFLKLLWILLSGEESSDSRKYSHWLIWIQTHYNRMNGGENSRTMVLVLVRNSDVRGKWTEEACGVCWI